MRTSSVPKLRQRPFASQLHRLAVIDEWARKPLVVLGVAATCGVVITTFATPRALPMLGGLAATIGIGTIAPWLAISGIRGHVRFRQPRCQLGEPVQTEVSLMGHTARWVDAASLHWPAAQLTASRRQAGCTLLTLVPEKRGRFPRRPPEMTTDRPFGLVTARREIPFAGSVVVRPPTSPICFPAALVAPRRHGREASEGVLGGSGDILGTRDYRSGDSPRHIHWAQTARRNRLVICERPGHGGPSVRLSIHLPPAGVPPGAVDPSVEAIVVIASSMLANWARRGVGFDIAVPGGSVCRVRDLPSLEHALDELACLEPVPATWRPDRSPPTPPQPSRGHLCDLQVVLGPANAVLSPEPADPPVREHSSHATLTIALDSSRQAAEFSRQSATEHLVMLPTTPAAVSQLDACLAEIGHDPDTQRA